MEYSCENSNHATGESEDGTMSCSDGLVISILSATYGRISFTICTNGVADSIGKSSPSSKLKDCDNPKDLTSHAQAECDGETSCLFVPTNGMEGDPCSGKYKYAWIYYTCETDKICKYTSYVTFFKT